MDVKKTEKGIRIQLAPNETIIANNEVPTFVEYEVEGSEGWCNEHPQKIGMHLATLIDTTPHVLDIHVRAGETWIVRRVANANDFIGE